MMRTSRWLPLLCWLTTATAPAARDPFQPAAAHRCAAPGRLQGIIGNDTRWVGWLSQPESGWRRIRLHDLVAPGDWRVVRLDRSGATLHAAADEPGCEATLAAPFRQREIIRKGNPYEE